MTVPRGLRVVTDPRADVLARLVSSWRETAGALRKYGDARGADLVEQLAGELEAALGGAAIAPTPRVARTAVQSGPDQLLTAEEAAARLGVSRSWLFRHWRDPALRPLAKKLGARTLRFSARRLDEHLNGKG